LLSKFDYEIRNGKVRAAERQGHQMDDLDRKILNILRRDARTPYTEIADDVGTSEGTVRNRVEQLVEDGVIERFTVATRTGNVKAMVEVGVDVSVDTHDISDRVVEWPEVDFVWQVSGEEDIVFVVDAQDTGRVNEIITKTRELDEVVSTKTRLILDERVG
jgi:DNA-binding Lrp family transcriptional regulator